MTITGAEQVDDIRYHLITNMGIFLLIFSQSYSIHGVEIPSFNTIEQAITHYNHG